MNPGVRYLEKDDLGDWNPEKDCLRLTFRQPVRKPSSESSHSLSLEFKNPGERFDWSINRVAVGKRVMWLLGGVDVRVRVMQIL